MRTDKELREVRARVKKLYGERFKGLSPSPEETNRFFRNAYDQEPNRLEDSEKARLMELSDAPSAKREGGQSAPERRVESKKEASGGAKVVVGAEEKKSVRPSRRARSRKS